ncbi:MAG: hypothetical protein L0210_01190 [Rhodospirillales bacterium]|nr:hypothetical protein [Rhodospirillales bacterium]
MRYVAWRNHLWVAAAAAVILSGCTQYPRPAKLGNSVAHNRALHTVNPDPHWGTVPPGLDGQRAALLMRRYSGQAVIQPAEVSTQ